MGQPHRGGVRGGWEFNLFRGILESVLESVGP